jgi:hypothetical protein
MLEDIRWPWQTNFVARMTDSKGYFELSIFDRTRYRVHANSRDTDDAVSAEPLPIGPIFDFNSTIRLVLTRKGHSAVDLAGKGLERWRAGLGL